MKTLEVLSGSRENITASHGRFGYYFRKRSSPTQPRTERQLAVRAAMSTNAAGWRALTDAQRAGWESLGAQMQRTDALGRTYTFNGFLAYTSVNNNNATAGDALVDDAPALVTPSAVATLALVCTTTGTPAMTLAYTVTPLAAGQKLFIHATPPMSAGKSFTNKYRLLMVTAAAAASPANIRALYNAKFGVPNIGERVAVKAVVFDRGFLSVPHTVNVLAE